MNFDEFVCKVEKIRVKKPKKFIEQDPPATDVEIAEVERELSLELPFDYKLFVKKYGGGYFFYTNIFSPISNSEWNIIEVNRKFQSKPIDFIAISDNEVGDYYGFKIVNGICDSKIYFWDHETDNVINTNYENLFEFVFIIGIEAGVPGRFD